MYERSQAGTMSFPSSPARRPGWERYGLLVIQLSVLAVLVLLIGRSFRLYTDTIAVFCTVLLIWQFFKVPHHHLSFDLSDDELIIHHHKGPTVIAYSDLAQFCAHSVEGHLHSLQAALTQQSYSFGKWRWKQHEITLYASQRSRLVLLDTEQGLIGISVAAEVEDRFVEELSRRTGLLPVKGEFTPQHAKKALSQFPLILFSVVLYMIGENMIRSTYPDSNVYQFAAFLLFGTLVMISLHIWERVHEKIPGLLLILTSALVAYSIFFGND